jgi:hypothetical protein
MTLVGQLNILMSNATSHKLCFISFRIQSGSAEDIFAYEGNDTEYQELYDTCLNEHLCICKNGSKKEGYKNGYKKEEEDKYSRYECDTPRVIKECSPPEQNGQIAEGKKQKYQHCMILFI